MKKPSHSLFFALVASALLLPVFATLHQPIGAREPIQMRGLLDTSAPANTDTNLKAPPTSAQTATSAAPTTSSTTSAAATTTAAASSATPSSATVTPAHASSAPASSEAAQSPATTVVSTTDASGQPITSVVVETPSMSSPTPSHTSPPSNDPGSGGLGTGSIVGLSVSGGIAAVGIILFFVWKFTRKRFADFDDNEAIKWPELNARHDDVHALPTNATGRAGFGPENDSDFNLTRAPSPGAYANSITTSVPETHGTGDPYAVPPLPHLNPNQPYRDEPGAYGQPGYYDPYRGQVPSTFGDTVSDPHGTEAIPMTRMRSPGPQMAYDMQGRGSPAPQAAMGYPGMDERSRTPVPGALATGRASPSPYGYGQH